MNSFYAKAFALFMGLGMLFSIPTMAQVQFNIRGVPGTSTYEVYMTPQQTWTGGLGITNSIQVSIRVPRGIGIDTFTVVNLTGELEDAFGASIPWTINSRTPQPIDASGAGISGEYDYIDFGMATTGPQIDYVNGTEMRMFTFENSASCYNGAGGNLSVELVDNATDPMVLEGNDYGVNTGNEISPLGALLAGALNGNAYTGFYTAGNANCGVNFPVEWLFFNATPNGSAVDLEWGTAVERGNLYFSIERSVDALLYEEIGKVDAVGNSSTATSYQSIDLSPFPGLNYYRLRQIDIDGSFTYSETVEVFFNPESIDLSLKAYPNPVYEGELVSLSFDAKAAMTLLCELYAANGQLLSDKSFKASKGKNTVQVPTKGLSHGLYHIRIYNDEYAESIKILVQ